MRRGPKSTDKWTTTDTKAPAEYSKYWSPGMSIRFDGTIDKSGERHTDLGVEIDEDDVIALHRGLIAHYRECAKERDKLAVTVHQLESALTKISDLVSWNRSRAPDQEALLSAIEEIAVHFGKSWNRAKPYRSKFEWLKWKTL